MGNANGPGGDAQPAGIRHQGSRTSQPRRRSTRSPQACRLGLCACHCCRTPCIAHRMAKYYRTSLFDHCKSLYRSLCPVLSPVSSFRNRPQEDRPSGERALSVWTGPTETRPDEPPRANRKEVRGATRSRVQLQDQESAKRQATLSGEGFVEFPRRARYPSSIRAGVCGRVASGRATCKVPGAGVIVDTHMCVHALALR